MHAQDTRVQSRLSLIGDEVKVSSRPSLTWRNVIPILCEAGTLAFLGLVLGGCGGGATIGVGSRQLVSVSVRPGSGQAVTPNGTVTFSAIGTFDQAPTTQPILKVQWASSNSNVASVDPGTGIATCLTPGGPITVTASATGKGGLIYGSGTVVCRASAPASMQGSWMFFFHSAVSDHCLVLEANLSEDGNHVFSDSAGSLVFEPASCFYSPLIELKNFGGPCDSGSVGDVTVDGTHSDRTVSVALSETGSLGSVVTTVSASNNGGSISNGTYSTPAACGFPEDHGSVEGYESPIAFSGDRYSGTLTFDGSAHPTVASFTSQANSFDLGVSGTSDGTSFDLNGSIVGSSMTLSGTIADKQVRWFGLYDPLYNDFFIYDSNSAFVGALTHTP